MIVAEGEVTHAVEAGLEAEVVEGKILDFLFFVANYSSIRPLLLFGHLTRPRLCMILPINMLLVKLIFENILNKLD